MDLGRSTGDLLPENLYMLKLTKLEPINLGHGGLARLTFVVADGFYRGKELVVLAGLPPVDVSLAWCLYAFPRVEAILGKRLGKYLRDEAKSAEFDLGDLVGRRCQAYVAVEHDSNGESHNPVRKFFSSSPYTSNLRAGFLD